MEKSKIFCWSKTSVPSKIYGHNSNGYPIFSTMADLIMTTSTSPDVGDNRCKMAAIKPELEITFERKKISMRFQRLPPHFRPCPTSIWHWRHGQRLAEVGRRWYTTKIQDGGQQKPEVEITFTRQVMAPRFQRLPPHYRPCPTSQCHRHHCPTLSDYRNSRWRPSDRK